MHLRNTHLGNSGSHVYAPSSQADPNWNRPIAAVQCLWNTCAQTSMMKLCCSLSLQSTPWMLSKDAKLPLMCLRLTCCRIDALLDARHSLDALKVLDQVLAVVPCGSCIDQAAPTLEEHQLIKGLHGST